MRRLPEDKREGAGDGFAARVGLHALQWELQAGRCCLCDVLELLRKPFTASTPVLLSTGNLYSSVCKCVSGKRSGCQQGLTTALLSSMPVKTSQNFLLVAAVRFRPAHHHQLCK